jgi:DNA-binding response OmpR family regulator
VSSELEGAAAIRVVYVVDDERLARATTQYLNGQGVEVFRVTRQIDVHVARLRQKLELDPRKPRLLETIRGASYILTPGAP